MRFLNFALAIKPKGNAMFMQCKQIDEDTYITLCVFIKIRYFRVMLKY